MQNLYMTTLLIDRNPAWRPTVATACFIAGREFSEDLLYKVTYALSDHIHQDEDTSEILLTVSDTEVVQAVEEYTPPPESVPPPENVPTPENVSKLEERLTQLEGRFSSVATLGEEVTSLKEVVANLGSTVEPPTLVKAVETFELPSVKRIVES